MVYTLFKGPAAAIALKLLEQPYKDNYEYNCAFLDSPVADLSYYCKIPTCI